METDHRDHCVKNVTANQLPTTTDVAIKFIIGKKTEGDLLEFKETGKESQKLQLRD